MTGQTLVHIGSVVIFIWGIGHLMPTSSIVKGFGPLSQDNRRIITMEWIAEGLTLCSIGVLASMCMLVGGPDRQVSVIMVRALAILLIMMAILSAFTGGRTSILPMKLCPYVKTTVALLFVIGSLM